MPLWLVFGNRRQTDPGEKACPAYRAGMAVMLSSIVLVLTSAIAVGQSANNSPGVTDQVPSYYPHWVTRDIDPYDDDKILAALPAGTTIGVHHCWTQSQLRKLLDFPSKQFTFAWYAESNPSETFDCAAHKPVAVRVPEASAKQMELLALKDRAGKPLYSPQRFTNEFELDAARDRGEKQPFQDAEVVRSNGFTYLAKARRRRN